MRRLPAWSSLVRQLVVMRCCHFNGVAITLLLLVSAGRVARAEPDLIPMDHVENGVYTLYNEEMMTEQDRNRAVFFQTTILEVKDGNFRYWFDSDAKMMGEPKYPLTGAYITKEGTISMELLLGTVDMGLRAPIEVKRTKVWRFMTYKGHVVLWPVTLLGEPKADRIEHNVLAKTNRNPEEIWRKEAHPH